MSPTFFQPEEKLGDPTNSAKGEWTIYQSVNPSDEESRSWWRGKVTATAACVASLLIASVCLRPFCCLPLKPSPGHSLWSTGEGETRSNGTHNFKRTVLLVSLDGFRTDYLERGLTPHLLDISRAGVRAQSMQPIFPTLTFPNHWTLLTGLHAESHGIIANDFWDPVIKREFHYTKPANSLQPEWWLGEPIWETAGRAGLITANLMWPGPPKTSSGASAKYSIPWAPTSVDEKHDQIMKWIDLPIEQRPQLIVAYEPSLDQAGHRYGPNSLPVNQTLRSLDTFVLRLQTSLQARNLTDIIDLVIVSDHGMADTTNPDLVYIDDIIGTKGMSMIEHNDEWPAKGLWFNATANITYHLRLLEEAADEFPEKFSVYTPDTMPPRYHFSRNERIAPIYVVPKLGYVLTDRNEDLSTLGKGNHGYDNEYEEMQAIFIARGPFTTNIKARYWSKSGSPKSRHSLDDDTYIMEPFRNTELYNLVIKLLGIEEFAAPTNGTVGFWDRYF